MLERVPAAEVRRHFVPGDSVEIYRGSVKGWVPATVQERRGKEEYPEPLSHNSPGASTAASVPQQTGASEKSGQFPVLVALHPWVHVRVTEKTEIGNLASEDVPLYLLRQPVADPAQKKEDHVLLHVSGV